METLARWQHPTRGLLMPAQFMGNAEQSGLIGALGATILAQACRDVADLNRDINDRLTVRLAVNVLARQLSTPGLAQGVELCPNDSGLDSRPLCLELTESTLMDDSIVTAEAIAQIRALGVELSVDDFGTGYSLPLYLRRFPVTSLKIDRSFIASLVAHAEDTSIVTGVIGRTVVAEGVEGVATPQQPQLPQDLGCSFAQGWLWSPALRAHELPVGSGTDIGAVPSSVLRSRSHAPARRGLPLRAADLARTGSLLHRDDSKATRARR